MAKSAKSSKMMKAKEPNDSKARGMSIQPKKPMTKNNVKGLMKPGKGK